MQTIKNIIDRYSHLIFLIVIGLVALLTYVPSMSGAGFYGDDYHIVYGAYTTGVEKLLEIAKIDRPFHGITFSLYFPVFGFNIHAYQIFELVLNVMTALLVFWIIFTIWPRQKALAFIAAILLIVYPGYSDHMRSFNYCLFMLNLFLYISSITLTIKAILEKSLNKKIIQSFLSICTFLWAVLINEYYIGLEVLRIGLISILINNKKIVPPSRKKILLGLFWNYLPYLFAGFGFFVWRFFIFSNQRGGTNLGAFTSGFVSSPFYESLSILRGLITNFFNISILAWTEPFYKFANYLRLKDFLTCAFIALIGALLVFGILNAYKKEPREEEEGRNGWLQMLLIGGFTIFATCFPIVFANRNVTFDYYGRYAIPGMVAGILFLLSIVFRFMSIHLRNVVIGLLVFSGIFTQLGVGKELSADWQGSKDFWWQLSWRAPSLEKGTLLTGYSSDYRITEGFNLWAPANIIYYPRETNPVVFGETLNTVLIHNVLEDNDTFRDFRSFELGNLTEKLLVLSKPSIHSCLHVIDGNAPNYSSHDTSNIMLMGSYSNLSQVDVTADLTSPPKIIFGEEPKHGWCYYYQKSDLALQKHDYEEIIRLEKEASQNGFRPEDSSELIPFILANAQLENKEKNNEIMPIFLDDPFNKVFFCQYLKENRYPISVNASRSLVDQYCQ